MTDSHKKLVEKHHRDQELGARRGLLEELFNDMYLRRRRLYMTNFVRGIFFGLGSAIGGTIVVALVVWILSIFGQIPGLGSAVHDAQQQIENRGR